MRIPSHHWPSEAKKAMAKGTMKYQLLMLEIRWLEVKIAFCKEFPILAVEILPGLEKRMRRLKYWQHRPWQFLLSDFQVKPGRNLKDFQDYNNV